jgi:hypothetical protein
LAANDAMSGSTLRVLKFFGGILCLLIVASNIWTMSRWSERRGVVDDLCYLRQAHLFQKLGHRGLDTNLKSETDNFFKTVVAEAGHPEWHTPDGSWCHIDMAATGKRVIQYPPGTGLLLAAFPEGFQVIPLYAAATVLVCLMAFAAIGLARSRESIAGATAFGCVALYFMINPTKASYSLAPTMVVCALAGFLTAALFNSRDRLPRLGIIWLVGLLLGISVGFRIANLVLSAGYFLVFLIAFARSRRPENFWHGFVFGLAYLTGLVPTLLANAVNAGSPFSTTYGADDTQSRHFALDIIRDYFFSLQGALVLVGLASVAWILVQRSSQPLKQIAIVVTANLLVNLVFFLSHPIYTSYYLMPVVMLSFWSLLFGILMQDRPSGKAVPTRAADAVLV